MYLKRLFVVAFLFVLSFGMASAQPVDFGKGFDINVTVESSDELSTIVLFELGTFEKTPVQTERGTYYKINCKGEPLLTNRSEPELPQLIRRIVISDEQEMEIIVLSSESRDFEGVPVVPSKGLLPTSVNPDTIPYTFGPVYTSDSWYPSELAEITEPFIFRDHRGVAIKLNAFQYNPKTQVLRVYDRVEVEVRVIGPGRVNVLDRTKGPRKPIEAFNHIYENQFINYSFHQTKDGYLGEVGDMLIITYDGFHDAMMPFVNWKRQKGIKTTIVDVDSIGNDTTSIKTFIHNFYDDPTKDLAWVLLVGDIEFIPAHHVEVQYPYGGEMDTGPSDPVYSLLAGSDDYPDIFVGRFSAESLSHVTTQVQRSISYERDHPNVETGWFHKGACIATTEHGAAQMMAEVASLLEGFTFTYVDRIFGYGANSSLLVSALNEGRSMVSYAGHGWGGGWSFGSFDFPYDSVDELHNVNMLPFIYSTACSPGDFEWWYGPCFAEHWLRATDGVTHQPTGAIAAYMASTIMYFGNHNLRMAGLLVNEGFSTIGGLCFNSMPGNHMFKPMNIFGDPSLQLCTDTPQELTVNHTGALGDGESEYQVEVEGVGGALCALYHNGSFHGSAYTDPFGMAAIPIEGLLPEDSLTLTVTAFNKATYIDRVGISNFPPHNFHVKVSTPNSITLAWTPKAAWNSMGYNIYRSAVSGQLGEKINSDLIPQPESLYTDFGLTSGQTFYYAITNVDSNYQESPPSSQVEITVGYPSRPTGLLSQVEGTIVTLSWSPNPLQENIIKYKIYHNGVLVDSVAASTVTYVDRSPKQVGRHWYRVTAANFLGEGLPSDSVSAYINSSFPLTSPYDLKVSSWNGTSVTLSWRVRQEAEGCYIYRSQVPGVYSKVPLNRIPIGDPLDTDITYQDTELTEGVSYYYVVTQVLQPTRPPVETPPSDEAEFLAGRPQTPDLRVKSSIKDIRLRISFFDQDIKMYMVFRKENGGAFEILDSVFVRAPFGVPWDATYTDESAIQERDYYYRVTATDTHNLESFPSDSVEGCIMSFDQGIMLVDMTRGGKIGGVRTGVNSDSVNAFYERALNDYSHTCLSLPDNGNGLTLFSLSHYPVTIVHSEDLEISQSLSLATYQILTLYLEAGGNLLIEGRKNLSGREGSPGYRDFASGDFWSDYLNLDSAYLPPAGFGAREFIGANRSPQAGEYPQTVEVDTFRVNHPLDDVIQPTKGDDFQGKLAGVGYLFPVDSAEVIYFFVSAYDTSSSNGKPVAMKHFTDEYRVIYFDFPLWFVKEDIAIHILHEALGELYAFPIMERIRDRAGIPVTFSFEQNYPNPFNPVTSMKYTVGSRQTPIHIILRIYNIRGQLVRTLVDEPQGAGTYRVIWDGKDNAGDEVASGVYFCKLEAGDFSQAKKMVLMK